MADVRIIEALYRSAREWRPVRLDAIQEDELLNTAQEQRKPPVAEPALVHTESPTL